jgi:hypothetical protein
VRFPVVHPTQQPIHLPVSLALAAWLTLDRYHAPGWLIGIVMTLIILHIVGKILMGRNQEPQTVVFWSQMEEMLAHRDKHLMDQTMRLTEQRVMDYLNNARRNSPVGPMVGH